MPSRTLHPGLCIAALALAGAAGCGLVRSLSGQSTIELENAQVTGIRLDLRKEPKTICPRAPVQLAVLLEARLEGEEQARWYETWQGRDDDADKDGRLAFEDFALHGGPGKIDEAGWFTPSSNLLATVDKGYTLAAFLRSAPQRHTATQTFKPDYDCITMGGARGLPGKPGANGKEGNHGVAAGDGMPGGDGNIGGNGDHGTDGGPGPELRAFVTMVKTRHYDQLVAVRIAGPTPDFLLFPPNKTITLKALGGPGGPGGRGGDGGFGADGGRGSPTPGDGGHGGPGGRGGNGGHGGNGGALELVFDERFPALANAVRLDVSGGAAGAPGQGGRGGRGGTGGLMPKEAMEALHQSVGQAERGSDGTGGVLGIPGKAGTPGTSSARAGAVADAFADLPGVTPL